MPLVIRTARQLGPPPPDEVDMLWFRDWGSETCWSSQVPDAHPGLPRKIWRETSLSAMRADYKKHRPRWERFLSRPSVTLTCLCSTPDHCRRRLFAEALVKLGAVYEGEVDLRPPELQT